MLKPEEIDELQLIIAQNGDDHAFGKVYITLIHNLQKFAYSIFKSRETG